MAVPTSRAFFHGVQDMITQSRVKDLFEYRDGILQQESFFISLLDFILHFVLANTLYWLDI